MLRKGCKKGGIDMAPSNKKQPVSFDWWSVEDIESPREHVRAILADLVGQDQDHGYVCVWAASAVTELPLEHTVDGDIEAEASTWSALLKQEFSRSTGSVKGFLTTVAERIADGDKGWFLLYATACLLVRFLVGCDFAKCSLQHRAEAEFDYWVALCGADAEM